MQSSIFILLLAALITSLINISQARETLLTEDKMAQTHFVSSTFK